MKSLDVLLATNPEQPQTIGRLFIQNRQIFFEYNTEWLSEGFSVSPYSLPLSSGLIKDDSGIWQGLHGVFNDSLPDGWGLLLMDREMRKAGINPRNITPLDRLAWLGHRTMGALVYEPSDGPSGDPLMVDLHSMANNAQQLFAGTSETVLPELFRAGGSPGGARPKALIAINGDLITTADGDIPTGYTPWLVKFNAKGDFKDAGKIEFAYSQMAKDAGIDMPETQLLEGEYFAVRRFDRANNQRIHVHTLGNLIASDFRIPSLDYADLFKVVLDITKSRVELLKAFHQMIFNIATHNRDDHSKNFAFIWNAVLKKWQLSPAYDLMYNDGVYGEHTMTVNGEGKKPSVFDILALARTFDVVNEVSQLLNETGNVIAKADDYFHEAGVSPDSIKQLKHAGFGELFKPGLSDDFDIGRGELPDDKPRRKFD